MGPSHGKRALMIVAQNEATMRIRIMHVLCCLSETYEPYEEHMHRPHVSHLFIRKPLFG